MTAPLPRAIQSLPERQQIALRRARRVEWFTLALRGSAVGLLYLALGNIQILTAVWLKSFWGLLPPIAFLAACRIERLPPRPRFPYGFFRAGTIAFSINALALTTMGLFLIYVGIGALLKSHHPTLATLAESGLIAWPGWPIIAAIGYSMGVPVVAGRMRHGLAVTLHDKGLYADAEMGRANWLAGGAGILGVLCIGLGFWRADFVATLIIGAHILHHGLRHLRVAICDLIDEVPRVLGSNRVDPINHEIRDTLLALDWVADARVRLREEGRHLTGIAFVHATDHGEGMVERLDAARCRVEALDWRLLDIELVPIDADRCDRTLHLPER